MRTLYGGAFLHLYGKEKQTEDGVAMKRGCYLFFIACSIALLEAQGTADGCVTCAVGDFLKAGWEDWILPAAQFLLPDSEPARDTTFPKPEPEKQGTNNLPGNANEPAIELEIVADPDKKCNPNGDASSSCAVATAQIVWPLPTTCGDESQASRIMEEINRLAPTGRVRPFHNKCGTWFFTASLSPLQIQQLMGEKIGIKFIAPDVEMKDDMESSPKVQKRRSDKLFGNRQSRTQKRSRPDFIHVRFEPLETAQLSYMSTPPDRVNSQLKFAWFDSVGSGATVYWIDRQFYLLNAELETYNMAANRLMAEDVSPQGEEWTSIQHGDHGGCMLSMIGGPRLGIMPQQIERGSWPQLKIVRVEPLVSSFFSGIEAIINELELRIERNEQIHTYTVIGSALTVPEPQFGRYLQAEAAILFKMLTNTFQAVVVVSAGPASELQPTNIWPAAIARQYPDIPIIAAKGADLWGLSGRGFGAQDPFPILRAVDIGRCKYINTDRYLYGSEPAIAYITGLATDMLTRPKVRTKLFIDNPALAPDEQKLQASRPVSAKIRDYLDSKSYDRMDGYRDIDQPMNAEVRGVWNGLDPDDLDINSYEA